MKTWTGQVEEISFKDWNNIKLWSFKIEGEDRWFRTQKTKLDAEVGDKITFVDRNNQVDLTTVSTASETDASGASPVVETKTKYDGDKIGERIQWQAARRDACNVIVAALALDAQNVDAKGVLPWASNVAKSKKMDLLRGYINELTKQFLEEENG